MLLLRRRTAASAAAFVAAEKAWQKAHDDVVHGTLRNVTELIVDVPNKLCSLPAWFYTLRDGMRAMWLFSC